MVSLKQMLTEAGLVPSPAVVFCAVSALALVFRRVVLLLWPPYRALLLVGVKWPLLTGRSWHCETRVLAAPVTNKCLAPLSRRAVAVMCSVLAWRQGQRPGQRDLRGKAPCTTWPSARHCVVQRCPQRELRPQEQVTAGHWWQSPVIAAT
jgi:hypothetical protein